VGALVVGVEADKVTSVADAVSVTDGTVAEATTVDVDVELGTAVALRVGVVGTPMVMLMGAQAAKAAPTHSVSRMATTLGSRGESIDILPLPDPIWLAEYIMDDVPGQYPSST
jgi:hypothetical protein